MEEEIGMGEIREGVEEKREKERKREKEMDDER